MPTRNLRLVPVPRTAEVIRLRPRKPLAERIEQAKPGLATLRDVADFESFHAMIFGVAKRAVEQRIDNVIALPLVGRRSTSQEIREVMQEDIRRGKR